jgi:SAM-dependent methyltransferase
MDNGRPWYQEFFKHDYRTFWSVGPDDPERTCREVDGVRTLLDLQPGLQVLDLCCGQGRHCIELARRGMIVTGLDLSATLLAEARQTAAAAGAQVRWVESDMRQIPFEGEFDAVLCMFTAFGYLESDEEDQKVLEAAARALRPGGRLLLDLANHDATGRSSLRSGTREWREVGSGRYTLVEHTMCLYPRSWRMRVICLEGARATEHVLSIRAYTADEIAGMVTRAGLEDIRIYGSLAGGEPTLDTNRLVVAARRL